VQVLFVQGTRLRSGHRDVRGVEHGRVAEQYLTFVTDGVFSEVAGGEAD
jgi:hypothetical protein